MISQDMVPQLFGDEVYDANGEKIGKVGQVYLDDETGQPAWVTVRTGLFGMKESFVPLDRAELDGDVLRVPVPRDAVRDAPQVDAEGGHITPEIEEELYRHYGLSRRMPRQERRGEATDTGTSGTGEAGTAAGTGVAAGTGAAAGTGTTDPRRRELREQRQGLAPRSEEELEEEEVAEADIREETDPRRRELRSEREGLAPRPVSPHDTGEEYRTRGGEATRDDAMTRSEERLRAHTEQVQTGRVRLRKYVVTEQQQMSVPVSHEEVRIEHEPITEANREQAMSGEDIREADYEVVLHEERAVVEKETTPVERVRLAKETVQDEDEVITGEVRKERIEIEDETGKTYRPEEHRGRRGRRRDK